MSNSGFAPMNYPDLGVRKAPGASAAHARGYAAGYAEGLRRAAIEHQAAEQSRESEHRRALAAESEAARRAVEALAAAVNQIRATALPLIHEVEGALIESALELAEAVLQREIAAGHVSVADTLRRALAAAPKEDLVAVRLHPEAAAAAAAGQAGAAPVEIIADESLAPGDAIAVLRDGWLDARLAAALARAKAVLNAERS